MNNAPSPVLRSIEQKPSIVDFYAIETEFKVVEREYNAIMLHMDNACLGAMTGDKECIKAEELNLQMQAYLIILADILAQIGPMGKEYQSEIDNQKYEVEKYSIKLKKQNTEIVAALELASRSTTSIDDTQIRLRQHQYEYVGWSVGTIILAILIYRQMMRK
jgi:hypothetical protein